MITATFYAPTKLSRRVQDNVKRHGGWFDVNPLPLFNHKSLFTVSFDSGGAYNPFAACIEIIQQPYFK